jgi:hypothetical protein
MLREIAVTGFPIPGWYPHPHRGRYEQVTLTLNYEQPSLMIYCTTRLPALIPSI